MNFTPFHFSLKTLFVVFFKLTAAEQSQQLTMSFLKGCYFPQLVLKNTIHSVQTISIFFLLSCKTSEQLKPSHQHLLLAGYLLQIWLGLCSAFSFESCFYFHLYSRGKNK